ncbi:acyl carrier protein [Burkholderia sp. Ac-20379]|uniref:acyl carrier protein n=1 Tax=Burkholderia sp. Ac-20379 TaxID=2703900 RepID=UPI001D6383D7|nr:acyl carrier protein [Burkholderia sp. Ac-20379]MBN3725611.1 acyl carrier protein [Burkholderia sp. Ac-20379]
MNRDAILNMLSSKIVEVVPDLAGRTIAPTDSMTELGLDSIERYEALVLTLEAIGLEVPLVKLHGPRNLGELADLLHALLAA